MLSYLFFSVYELYEENISAVKSAKNTPCVCAKITEFNKPLTTKVTINPFAI